MGGSPGNAELIEFDNYEDVHAFAQSRRKRKLGHNTWLLKCGAHGEQYAIRYQCTDVVVYRPGIVSLYSGGWQTMTTKARLNAYLPGWCWGRYAAPSTSLSAHVWTQCGTWYLTVKCAGSDESTYDFNEGISLHSDGRVTTSWNSDIGVLIADPEADKRAYNRAAYRQRKEEKARWDADAGPREERLRRRAEAHERLRAEQETLRRVRSTVRELQVADEAVQIGARANGRAAATGTHQEKKDELERRIDTVLAECSSKVPVYRMSK